MPIIWSLACNLYLAFVLASVCSLFIATITLANIWPCRYQPKTSKNYLSLVAVFCTADHVMCFDTYEAFTWYKSHSQCCSTMLLKLIVLCTDFFYYLSILTVNKKNSSACASRTVASISGILGNINGISWIVIWTQ